MDLETRFRVVDLAAGSEGQTYWYVYDDAIGDIIATFGSPENAEIFREAKVRSLQALNNPVLPSQPERRN